MTLFEYVKVNNKSLDLSYIECISKDVGECEFSPVTYKSRDMLCDKFVRTDTGSYKLKISLLINASGSDEMRERIQSVKHNFYNCEIKFSGDNKIYNCILQSTANIIKSPFKSIVDFEFLTEIYSEKQTVIITKSPQTINISGSRDTGISFEITALQNISDFKINDITVKSLTSGATTIIDGDNVIADFSVVDFIKFPVSHGSYIVNVDDIEKANIKISFRSRW